MSEQNIIFKDFDITEGKISFICIVISEVEEEQEYNLFFQLNRNIVPRHDLIALALSTLCGNVFSNIHFDLEVCSETIIEIEKFTKSRVTVSSELNSQMLKKNRTGDANISLNFSGGFDSLAALCLMPEKTKLVSMNFGKSFERERTIFLWILIPTLSPLTFVKKD
ncbi:hypothetical protein ACX12E_03535 [Paenibacillus vandeheii]